jgi:hypothetical protein
MTIFAVMRLAVLLWTLLVVTASARGADLWSFQYHRKVLSFVVANSDPITATVNDSTAANLALKWAVGFYGVEDANVDGIELHANPTRFWLVFSQSVAAKNARQFTGLFSWMDPSLHQLSEIYSKVCEASEQGT